MDLKVTVAPFTIYRVLSTYADTYGSGLFDALSFTIIDEIDESLKEHWDYSKKWKKVNWWDWWIFKRKLGLFEEMKESKLSPVLSQICTHNELYFCHTVLDLNVL